MFTFPRRLALIVALASIGALFAVSSASATVEPPVVNNNTLTVTSDAAGDTITLGVAAGVITVNGTATTLAADANAQVVVNAGGGSDTVDAIGLAAANYKTLTINGGEGDDLLTGGAGNDGLHGDAGEDRLVGFKGVDLLDGGEGSDVLVWNNGDASDRDEGGAGTDEVEVNGAPTAADEFTAKPDAGEPGSVLFERTNLIKFEIQVQAERLTVNGLGGPDHFTPDPEFPTGLAGLTSLTVNGGSAGDRLVGGDGADQINGGTGADSLGGGGGADQINGGDENDIIEAGGDDDRIVGGTGGDTLIADSGDDAIVWNNGDGTDPVNDGGPGFDRVEVNGSVTAGDVLKLTASPSTVTFQRTNLVPFTLKIDPDNEVVTVNGGGGNDMFTAAQEGSGLLVIADGGPGNDELSGANEADSFFGGSGDDMLTGGGGSDLLDGGEGDDRLLARDGTGDLVRGGVGTDRAQTDQVTVDAVNGVEVLDATPAPEPQPPADTTAMLPTVGKFNTVRNHGKLIARAPVSCLVAEAGGCRTTLTLVTAKAVSLGRVRAVLVLGSATVALTPGGKTTVSIRMNGGAVGLARHGRLPTRLQIASTDAAGNSAARSVAVGLRIPRR
jgi:Ca2+-binding RTX toxin-like protein